MKNEENFERRSYESEVVVLAAIFTSIIDSKDDSGRAREIIGLLSVDDFAFKIHKNIFKALQEYCDSECGGKFLKFFWDACQKNAELGADYDVLWGYLFNMLESTSQEELDNAESYIDRLIETKMLRQLLDAAREIRKAIARKQLKTDCDAFLEEVKSYLESPLDFDLAEDDLVFTKIMTAFFYLKNDRDILNNADK